MTSTIDGARYLDSARYLDFIYSEPYNCVIYICLIILPVNYSLSLRIVDKSKAIKTVVWVGGAGYQLFWRVHNYGDKVRLSVRVYQRDSCIPEHLGLWLLFR